MITSIFFKACNQLMLETDQPIFTVSTLNQAVRSHIETAFPWVWVEGELSNIARSVSGHIYFSLKDPQAQIRCAMFRMQGRQLPVQLKEGMQVLVRARVSLYEARGDYQLIVDKLEPRGDGLLQQAFEALKKQLIMEGLFEASHKQSLPSLPQCIGVITSSTGAALQDILSVLARRFIAIPVIVYPTAVQGAQACDQIVRCIEIANYRKECDVLILARGGGSLEDLWPFNEEKVARAIYHSEIPLVSGVGHEVDFTIADFVADVRAPTPSAAAETVSPSATDWLQHLTGLKNRLNHSMYQLLSHWTTQLIHKQQRLQHPKHRLQGYAQQCDYLEQGMIRGIRALLEQKQNKLSQYSYTLNAISPLATLGRGYAIITDTQSGAVITSARTTQPGQKVKAQLAQGTLDCEILA